MPAPTDHSERRDELARLATQLIGTEGLHATTIRRLAAEAGFSTAIVTHYFANKRELLFKVYEYVSLKAIRQFRRLCDDPARSLHEVMEAFMPIGEEERISYRVVFAFWHLAQHDEEFASRQRLAMRQSQQAIEAALRSRGHADNAEQVSEQLLVSVMGTSIRASFEPDWNDDVLRGFLGDILEAHVKPVAKDAP